MTAPTTTPAQPEALQSISSSLLFEFQKLKARPDAMNLQAFEAKLKIADQVAALTAAPGVQAEPLHITHGPLMRYAAFLLRSRRPALPEHASVADELEMAADGHPTPAGEPSAEWLEVARIAEAAPAQPAEGAGYAALVQKWRHAAEHLGLGGLASLADCADELEAVIHASPAQPAPEPFQQRVQPWMMECFGPVIAADRVERNHRFLEESLELVQSLGCTQSEAHQLVDYVFGRPVGEPAQEVGGVMVTLAALCLASSLDMHDAGEVELARISAPEIVAKIRAKQAAKPKHSPLPEHARTAPAQPAPEPINRTGCTAGTDEACTRRGCGTNCPALAQPAPAQDGYPPLPEPQYQMGGKGHSDNAMRDFADRTHALRASHGQAPAAMYPADGGEVPGHGMPDWPAWCSTFRERKAYQHGIADARRIASAFTAQPAPAGATLSQIMAVAKELYATDNPSGEPEWAALRQCEVDVWRARAERVLKAANVNPTAQPAPAATPTAASLAWNALRDLTDPLGEDGAKIMGHIRTYAQRQYEAGLAEGRAVPATGAVVGPGWKLVPVEPTDEMLNATYAGQHCSDVYRDMLAAAPTPAAQGDAEDAARYRWLRVQDNEDFEFAVVKNPHFDVFESPEALDAAIDARLAALAQKEQAK